MMQRLQAGAQAGVIDYGFLMSCLQEYKAPHRKISTLLKSGDIVRVKKGLYVLGENYRDTPISRLLLANLIYGSSYVSQEYALYHYGLLPERVETVTSMTIKRNKIFSTPFGFFNYSYINFKRFTVGVDWLELGNDLRVFIASPEKALVDTVSKYRDIKTADEMLEHLIENMRIPEEALLNLDLIRLQKIQRAYSHSTINLLYRTLNRRS